MKLRDKLLISLGFVILMAFAIINFFSIEQLKGQLQSVQDDLTVTKEQLTKDIRSVRGDD